LDETLKTAIVVVATRGGRRYWLVGFSTGFRHLRERLGRSGKIGTVLTFHGLRHTIATELVDAGADDATIADVTGHRDPAMVRRYTATRGQKKRAAAAIRLVDTD